MRELILYKKRGMMKGCITVFRETPPSPFGLAQGWRSGLVDFETHWGEIVVDGVGSAGWAGMGAGQAWEPAPTGTGVAIGWEERLRPGSQLGGKRDCG